MKPQELFDIIDRKDISREEISNWVMEDNSLLRIIFNGLDHKKANIKYGCEKILRILSDINPDLLYPHFHFFVGNLDKNNKFIKLGSVIILSNLTAVDEEGKFEKIQSDYFSIITSGDLTLAVNVIKSIPTIIKYKPQLEENITDNLLKVVNTKFKTEECRNIALGHTIDSFYKFFPQINNKESVINFVNNQLTNRRKSTINKALKFKKRYKIN